MNSDILLKAIGEIDDHFILAAQKRLGNMFLQEINADTKISPVKPKRSSRRVFIAIAAAVIFTLASFTTAMAVSEEFREAVFSFFKISSPEAVPEYTPDVSDDSAVIQYAQTDMDGLVSAEYVWLNHWASSTNGIFRCTKDEIVYNRGSRFDLYAEENGELIAIKPHTVLMDYSWKERDYHIEFEWGAHGDKLSFAYVMDGGDKGWHFSYISGRADIVLITFEHSLPGEREYPMFSEYPMIFDLSNEVIIDVLAGCGVDEIPDITNSAFSDDLTKAVFAQTDGTLYYCDVSAKALYSVDGLSGEHTDACSFADNALLCWALGGDGNYKCWSISLSSFERTEIFSGIPAYNERVGNGLVFINGFDTAHHAGYMYYGSGFALEVAKDKSVYVLDLSSGEKTIIEGFLWPDGCIPECIISPTGTSLLIVERNYGSAGYDRIGVLDYASKTYIQLSREDFNLNEQTVYWFDQDRIVISTGLGEDGSGAYIYSFNKP